MSSFDELNVLFHVGGEHKSPYAQVEELNVLLHVGGEQDESLYAL
jgi:hypothetical protein